MITKLYSCFGLTGIFSIIGWIGAAAMFAWCCGRKRKTVFCVRTTLVALLAWLLAWVNSYNVSMIQVDRSRENEEARQRQMQARADEMRALRERAAEIRFVEDGKYDYYDLAGVTADEKKSIYELAAEGKDIEPLYRKAGKQTRIGSDREPSRDTEDAADSEEEKAALTAPRVKMLPEKDRVYATRLARLNLRISALVVVLALLMLLYDYFSRFNTTFECVLPLPFSCRILDQLFPKKMSLLLRSGDSRLIRLYMETVLRKGESFLYFGPRSMAGEANLARLYIPYRRILRDFLVVIYPAGLAAAVRRIGSAPWRRIAQNARRSILQMPGGLAVRSRLLWVGARIGSLWNRTRKGMLAAALKARAQVALLRSRVRRLAETIGSSNAWQACVSALSATTTRAKERVRSGAALAVAWAKRRAARVRDSRGLRAFAETARAAASRTRRSVQGLLASIVVRDGAINMFPTKLLSLTTERKPFSREFVFESAWFNRYCFVIEPPAMVASMVASLLEFLAERYRPHAAARRTVHIMLDMDDKLLSGEDMKKLLFLAREANYKLVLFAPEPGVSHLRSLVEEVACPTSPSSPPLP